MFFHQFPISFQMATLVSPIPCSMVIWFGSLKFMSTGFGYDMILLSVKGPGGARIAPTRLRAPRRPRHHASPPKKRRGQCRHHSSASSRSPARARQAVTQESTTRAAEPWVRQPNVTRTMRRRWVTTRLLCSRPPRRCYRTNCSPQEEHSRSA
jgi:hypothetical protein